MTLIRPNHRFLIDLAPTAMLIAMLSCSIAAAADPRDPALLHREILEIIHGDPRNDVAPSPFYCARRGLIPENLQMPALEWYVTGKGACSAVFLPDLASIHSPLSNSVVTDADKHRRLVNALTELADALEKTRVSLGDQFDLQMTLWDTGLGIPLFAPEVRSILFPNCSQDWNIGNAFLHAFSSCLLSAACGTGAAESIGNAREQGRGSGNPCQRAKMDLHNNDVGRQLGVGADPGDCVDLVLGAARGGQLRWFNPSPSSDDTCLAMSTTPQAGCAPP